jgi:hypothetical protein
VPGVEWPQILDVALVARSVLADFGLTGWPKTSGSRGMHIYARIAPRWPFADVRKAAVAVAREIERRAPEAATSKWWKEERHGVFVDYNQNAKDRTVASAYSVRPLPDARVSTPLTWDEVPSCDPAAFTIDTVPQRFGSMGDPWAPMNDAVGSLDALLELAARDEAAGLPDAPWPPHYEKQAGEDARVQPSKRRRAASPGPADATAEPAAAPSPDAPSPDAPSSATPRAAGRRQSTKPLIEIARAQAKAEALDGLERWKARHPDVWPLLEPADVLVDSMRGRSSTWTRIRLNLEHVPEPQRPPQEPLEVDYDPWAGGSSSRAELSPPPGAHQGAARGPRRGDPPGGVPRRLTSPLGPAPAWMSRAGRPARGGPRGAAEQRRVRAGLRAVPEGIAPVRRARPAYPGPGGPAVGIPVLRAGPA